MFHEIKELVYGLKDWMIQWAHTPWSVYALFGIAFAESSFFPLPPDILLIACGLLSPQHALYFALICTLGSTLGGCFGYFIGLKGGRPILDRLISKEKLLTVEAYFQKYDVWAVGIAGFTPIPYKLFTISGGVFRIHFWKFVLISFLSRGGRFFLVSLLIYLFGETIEHYLKHYFDLVALAFVVLLVGGFWFLHHFSSKNRS